MFIECNVDGEAFINLSREDLAILFNLPTQFVMASKLYKVVQRARSECVDIGNTQGLLEELSYLEKDHSWSCSQSCASSSAGSVPTSRSPMPLGSCSQSNAGSTTGSIPSSSRSTTRKRQSPGSISDLQSTKRLRLTEEFTLPFFSPVVQQCIKRDSFYTTTQRNRLVKEACSALRGFCYEREESVTTEKKRHLAAMLLKLAPKSLKDTEKEGRRASPEVRIL